MTRHLTAACILCGSLGLNAATASAQAPTVTGSPAIADTVAHLFAGIADATNDLNLDRLLAYYDDSEALTYVAQGRVIRSRAAFGDLLEAQLRGLAGADLRFLDTYVDVLSDDVAVVTATYEFDATLPDGRVVPTAGTYTCLFVRHDGRWQVRHSSHTFPASQP
jgi:ketosteroid isomerase-like protein